MAMHCAWTQKKEVKKRNINNGLCVNKTMHGVDREEGVRCEWKNREIAVRERECAEKNWLLMMILWLYMHVRCYCQLLTTIFNECGSSHNFQWKKEKFQCDTRHKLIENESR